MAGDRVREDPVVAPFSVGRNLLTVYSKKHINDVPALRGEKLKHNRRTIASTVSLFKAGGATLWFAPSGGRDRRSPVSGAVEVSPFDADAVDVMRMSAKKAGTPTHFYPMSLITHDMLPPPETVGGAEVGERRTCSYTPVHMAVGEEVGWKCDAILAASKGLDKVGRRKVRAQYIEDRVREGYAAIGGLRV
jgi:glycerol-3-phosphate O-acyltransferase